MSAEGKLVLALICLVAGVVAFAFGGKELKLKYGVITKVLFPAIVHPIEGKLMGVGLWVVALPLCWQAVTQ